jgi:hypothetical protein
VTKRIESRYRATVSRATAAGNRRKNVFPPLFPTPAVAANTPPWTSRNAKAPFYGVCGASRCFGGASWRPVDGIPAEGANRIMDGKARVATGAGVRAGAYVARQSRTRDHRGISTEQSGALH